MNAITNTYLEWRTIENEVYYFSIEEILEVGAPIDEDGTEMELYSENLYKCVDGQYSKI
jgi:hypothetical protein